jgi:hypothetical protein
MREECLDCSHLKNAPTGQHCYMFLNEPRVESYMQHDKYKSLRNGFGKELINHPEMWIWIRR